MASTDLTVAAVVEKDGQYLLVEEFAMGAAVFNQPGGHIESGESPEKAVVREVLEETGCRVTCGELIGVYLWVHPKTRQRFLRLAYVADYVDCDVNRELDTSIIRRLWLSSGEIELQAARLRTPAVLRCVRDYESGRRGPDELFAGHLPLQQQVEIVIANASRL